eukprot:Rhum_TRINITY_DN16084_c0_g1::Rhum_TRINITY_DN16084_c0_g1_i1::g.162750::m.162750/K19054/FXN; frataxin
MLARVFRGGAAASQRCTRQQVRWCKKDECSAEEFRQYRKAVYATLDAVCEVFDEEGDKHPDIIDDINPMDGVLEVHLSRGETYVFNKQEPLLQLWMSSPVSGPSQFALNIDAATQECVWVDPTNGRELRALLRTEFSELLSKDVTFPPVSASNA